MIVGWDSVKKQQFAVYRKGVLKWMKTQKPKNIMLQLGALI